MGLAYRGAAVLNSNGVAIAGSRVRGIAGAGHVVYQSPPSVPWQFIRNAAALQNNVSAPALDTTNATLIILCATGTVGTISDSRSNQWTRLILAGSYTSIYYAVPPIHVGPNHTFQMAGSTMASMIITAFMGAANAGSVYDQTNFSSTGGPNTSITPTINNTLAIAAATLTTTGAISVALPFATVYQNPYSAGSYWGVAMSYYIQATASLIPGNWAGTASPIWAAIANFRPS